MKLSDYVIRRLAQEVSHIFMLAGGGCMHLVDSVGRCENIEYICNLHEQACAIAADAYGQYTNNLGVALVTTGPGGTNAVTGAAAAWIDSTPTLFLSGQVKRPDLMTNRGVRQMGFQEADIVNIVRPITKYAVTVLEPDSIRYHLERAIHLAKSGRPGPVWLDIPLDVQAAQVNPEKMAGYDRKKEEDPLDKAGLRNKIREVIRSFNQAERPIILAGNGIRLGKALDLFYDLLDLLQAPVLTTWKAIDYFDENHPLFMGRPGATAQRYANFAQQNADWLLVLGARLDLGQTAYNHRNFAKSAKIYIVEIDQAELDKLDMSLAGSICVSVREFLQEFLKQKQLILPEDRSAWLDRCRQWKTKYPVILPEYFQDRPGVNTYALIETLAKLMDAGDLLIPGSSGACSELTMQSFKVKKGMRVFNSPGLGSMGFGIPASIGGCIAGGGRRTVCIDGDGGFQMNIQELETVKRLKLPIKLFVLNNAGYGSIRATQNGYFAGRYVGSDPSSGLTLPSTIKIARAYGIPSVSISHRKHLDEKVAQVLTMAGPVICDVKICPNQEVAPRISSLQKEDGTMESRPMEDLWPFLDREEFRDNMSVRGSDV